MLYIFAYYFLILLASISIFYFIGHTILFVLKIYINDFYTNLFAKLLLGCTLFVVGTAAYYTRGVTVTLFFIPALLILAFLYTSKNRISDNKPTVVGRPTSAKLLLNFGIFFCGSAIFFIWRFGQIYNSQGDIPLLPHPDIVYYSNCIDFLIRFGHENSSLDYTLGLKSGTSPYHYYHLWLGAGVSRIFCCNCLLTLTLVIYSFGCILTWIGFGAVFSFFKTPTAIDICFCFFLVFLTGIVLDMYTKVHFMQFINVFSQNTLSLPKLFPVYIFSIAAFLFLLKNKQFEAVLCLIFIMISSIATAPSLMSAILAWQLINYLQYKRVNFSIVFSVLFFSILVFSFYKFFTVQTNSHVSTSFMDIFDQVNKYTFYRTAFNIGVGATLQFMLIFSPFLTMFIFAFGSKKTQRLINTPGIKLLILVYISSLLGWALLHYKTSTTQIFTKISVPWLNLLSSFILIKVWIFAQVKRKYLVVILIFITLSIGIKNSLNLYRFEYSQSAKYLATVKAHFKNLSSNGSFIYDKSDYNFPFSYISNFAIQGSYLAYSINHTFPLSLSPYSFPVSTDPMLANMQKEALQNTPFFIYVEKQKQMGTFKSIQKSQLNFINEMKINYLICTKNVVLPELLEEKVKTKIIDDTTGEVFILFK